MLDDGIRIAMWSGPRNISTAMLRSWGNRPDAFVSDEPFYAYYLKATGIDHPGAEETMATYETDWRAIVATCTGPIPNGKSVWYQKHMTHHMLPEIDLAWTRDLVNCFLIRSPQEMITSYIKVRPDPTLQDMGLAEQRAIFDHVHAATGAYPPVVDARDVLLDPARVLPLLCEAIGVPFTEAMLQWPAGKRETDGTWAKYWYDAVEASTGFAPYRPKNEPVPPRLQPLLDQCNALYAEMYEHRIR